MAPRSVQSGSPWKGTALPAFPALDRDVEADVCVIGAGIAGLSTAYALAREGRSVIVLEDGTLGSGQTARTSAHLSNAVDDRYAEIEQLFGEEAATLTADSHSAAIDRIERIVAEERIDCDFRRLDGYLFFPPGSRHTLESELSAAARAGLSVDRESRAPIESFDTGPCLRFPNQAQFHPMKYVAGLARAFREQNGRIFCGTRAVSIEDGPRREIVTSIGPVVRARAIVVATNVPFNDRFAVHTKQAAYLTYVIAAQPPRSAMARALYWDDEDPYHYVRFLDADASSAELLLIGGEDHRSGQVHDQEQRFQRLETWARERFPTLGAVELQWSGQVMEPVDGIAFIGRNPHDEDVFVVTGDSGMGMTHGTIAGILITDLLLGRNNPWAKLYDPSRKTLRAARRYAEENVKTVARYADWLTAGDVENVDRLAPGQGGIVRDGLRKIAAYRDERGELCTHSAICPHLGCIVQWNAAAKTWDCPCHGSRFDCRGEVVVGPANRGLTPVGETATAARRGR